MSPESGVRLPRVGLDALQALNRQLRALGGSFPADGAGRPDPVPMRSVQRFAASWARWASQERVTAAVLQLPDNAGPLNSQRLAARALQQLQALSPDYVRCLLGMLDAYDLALSEDALTANEPGKVDGVPAPKPAKPRARPARRG